MADTRFDVYVWTRDDGGTWLFAKSFDTEKAAETLAQHYMRVEGKAATVERRVGDEVTA